MSKEERDALGSRMKGQYEQRAATHLPRRTCTVIRLDGKGFHSYTRGLERPWDQQLAADMAATAAWLCEGIQGARLAYTQSDEISLILTDFATPHTDAWFDGNVQKIVSISASMATAKFNELRPGKLAMFDSRVFTIPDVVEVGNYLVWRQADATRNSISMAAQANFSHRQLQHKSGGEMQEMLWSQRGINWNDYDPRFKRGTVIVPQVSTQPMSYVDKRSGDTVHLDAVERRAWIADGAPIFTRDKALLTTYLPGWPAEEEAA